jgi:hypothetical protein
MKNTELFENKPSEASLVNIGGHVTSVNLIYDTSITGCKYNLINESFLHEVNGDSNTIVIFYKDSYTPIEGLEERSLPPNTVKIGRLELSRAERIKGIVNNEATMYGAAGNYFESRESNTIRKLLLKPDLSNKEVVELSFIIFGEKHIKKFNVIDSNNTEITLDRNYDSFFYFYK